MTVKDLRDLLAQMPDDALVILAEDPEGNGYGPLESVVEGAYNPITTYSGDFWSAPTAPRMFPINAVCLTPVN